MATKRKQTWRVRIDNDTKVSAVMDDVTGVKNAIDDAVFVCAHGAGGSMNDTSTRALAAALSKRGLRVVRFNFVYAENKIKRPDRMERVIECYSAVVAHITKELAPKKLFLGGRSMGGRASTMMAADGFACDALLLYAYPLHPAGAPDKLRVEHLPRIRVPVCCFNGTRDALCTESLMNDAIANVKTRWEQHWIDGADHSFHVLKSSGTNDADVLARIADDTLTFVGSV